MQRSFRVVDHYAFEGEFGHLDVHNSYDLIRIEYAPAVRFVFLRNEYGDERWPRLFAIEFKSVSSLKIENLPRNGRGFQIDDIDVKEWEDQERYLTFVGDEEFDNTYLAFFGWNAECDDASIRIRAAAAEILVLES